MTTIDDVALHAKVSRQTVSNVLNAPERVRPATIARVRLSVEALGYRANRNARNLRNGTSMIIAYRIPPLAGRLNSVMDTFLHEITEALEGVGYHVLLFTSQSMSEELETYRELAAQSAVDAVIFAGTERNDPRPAQLVKAGIPFVSFGRTWGPVEHSWVDVDGRAGTQMAISHLLDSGHRRFAWLGTADQSVAQDERELGVRETLVKAGVPTEDLHVLNLLDNPTDDRRLLGSLLDQSNAPTAFVCMSDLQALTVLSELESRLIAVGTEAAVIGFDDSPIAAYAGGGLTTIRQPITTVTHELARLLAHQLANPSSAIEGVLLTPELIVRRTG